MKTGTYELVFYVGDYFGERRFLDRVPGPLHHLRTPPRNIMFRCSSRPGPTALIAEAEKWARRLIRTRKPIPRPPAWSIWPRSASAATRSLANDEFFAEKENLLKPGRGIFIPDKYTDRGKWMDGWESRRRRTPGT